MSAGVERDIGSKEYTCADSDEASVENGAAGIDECPASDTDVSSVIRVERRNYDRFVIEQSIIFIVRGTFDTGW